jgi:hypothetical protein
MFKSWKQKLFLVLILFFLTTSFVKADMYVSPSFWQHAQGIVSGTVLIIFVINLLVEVGIASVFLKIKIKKIPSSIIGAVAIANIISWPLLFLFQYLLLEPFSSFHYYLFNIIPSYLYIILGELIVVFLEAFIIYLFAKKHYFGFNQSLILSVITNFFTIILGLLISLMLIF